MRIVCLSYTWMALLASGCGQLHTHAATSTIILPAGTQKILTTSQRNAPLDWNLSQVAATTLPIPALAGHETTVAVLDTGVDDDHPDLKDNLEATIDLIGTDVFAHQDMRYTYDRRDGNGHGTHVSSIIAQLAQSSAIRILPIKIIGHSGTGQDSILTTGIEKAIAWRSARGGRVRVINLSVASQAPSERLKQAIDKACKANILVVVAAGNDHGPVEFPASLDNVLTVGATTYEDETAPYSAYGPAVDLCAPGGDSEHPIMAAWPRYLTASDLGDGIVRAHDTQALVGTSMAAPHVSAAAAILWSVAPYLGAWQVRARLLASADDRGEDGWDPHFGFGRLNLARSIRSTTHDAI